MPERVSLVDPPETRAGHEARYRMVVDAACGTGYGRTILQAGPDIDYTGVERDLSVIEVPLPSDFLAADLDTWQPAFDVDVAIGFETLEHLADPAAYVAWTSRVRRLLFLSVPFPPTLGANPYHLHDYSPEQVRELYAGMREVAYFSQPAEQSGVWIFAP